MGIFKKINTAVQNFRQQRADNRLKRIQARQGAKSDREEIAERGASDRAQIAASAGFDSRAEPAPARSSGGGGKVWDKVKDFGGNVLSGFLGGNQNNNSGGSSSTDPPKEDNSKMMLLGLGGLAVVMMMFMNKKK